MRLKFATVTLLVADLILFVSCGFSMAAKPQAGASVHERKEFLIRSFGILSVLLLSLFATVILVWIWMRRLRLQYLEESQQNLQTLIEGTLQDHESKQS